MKRVLIVAVLCVIIDQAIKYSLTALISFGDSVHVIGDFFTLTLLQNTGAAFSILSSNTVFLIVVSLFALCLIYVLLIQGKKIDKVESYLYGILIGGVIGNLLDRIIHGYVVDYLSFSFGTFHIPIFNFADMCIIISIGLIIIHILKGEKNEVSSK